MSDQSTNTQLEEWKQVYTSLIEFGRSALTSSALLNGGAAAAIIAAATADVSLILSRLFWAILFFSLGAASALLALGLAYFSEFCFLERVGESQSQPKYQKYEGPVRWWAIICGLLSFILFVGGIVSAFLVLR
ncbi:MAG: hypothetical protein JEY79_03985 [Pseudodesulfovibrio sp.]|nr:hypothetical protein [Pseudodesulfovibrio sp.]